MNRTFNIAVILPFHHFTNNLLNIPAVSQIAGAHKFSMTNRLPNDARTAVFCAVFAFFLLHTIGLHAQPFTFSYPGPTVIGLGPNCETTLADKLGTPEVVSTIGATITMSMFDSVATGFGLYSPLPMGMHNIRWLVKDDQGNSTHYTFKVTLVDNTPPEFDPNWALPVLTVASIAQVPPPFLPVSDNCTPTIDIDTTFSQTTPPALCQAGSFTRTWTAMDNAGNTTVFTQTVHVTADNQPPSLGALPQGLNAVCMDLPTQYSNWLAAQLALVTSGASDPSGIKSITHNGPATYPAGCPAPITVVFRVTDSCDVFKTASATFAASDTQLPVVISPAIDTFAYCTADSSYLQKLGDYIHNRGWLQMEDCTLTPRSNWSMEVNGAILDSAGVVAALLASFNKPCGFKLIGGKSYPKVRGSIPIDFFVRDACHQQPTVDKGEFGVIDTLGPQISGSVTTEQCGGGNDQTALVNWINAYGNATLKDGCSAVAWNNNFTYVTSNGQTGSGTIHAGPYPSVPPTTCSWFVDVTFRAGDDCGNSSSGTLRFRVVDTQAPVMTIDQPSTTVFCPMEAPVTLPHPAVADNCDNAPKVDSIRQVIPDASPFCHGNYTVRITWRAVDKCGNSSTAIQTFFVRDTVGPVFDSIPLASVMRCDTFVLPPAPIAGVNIFASDECSPVQSIKTQTLSGQNPNPATCGHYNYTITRIFLATDGCGNTTTATQAIQVIDNLGPVLSGIADTTMRCDVTPLPPPPTGVDACSGSINTLSVQSSTDSPGLCGDQYTRTIVYRAFDVCGNFGEFTQTVHVIDTVKPILIGLPPDLTVSCENIPPPPPNTSFALQDNCDASPAIALAETEVRDPDLANCAHWSNYLIRRTWTVTDNCGNNRAYTQTIAVRDNTPPVLTLPANITRPADLGQCSANTPIPAPVSLFDECTALQTSVTLSNTAAITNNSGAFNATEPVNPIIYSWTAPNLPPGQPVIGTASVRFFIYNADINNATEYFNITVEGDPIGSTNTTGGTENCRSDSSTILSVSANKMNQWLADGQLNMALTPNGNSAAAVNLINCGGAPRVRAVWSYQIATQQTPIDLTYQLDNGPETPYTPTSNANLSVGPHTIGYVARDCAGNSTTALLTFTVQDLEPPTLTPPANLTVFTGSNNCVASATLPFPAISENCSLAGSLMRASAYVPIQFESDPEIGDLVPKNAIITINGLIPNAVGPGRLRIQHIGDNALPGEFFSILDETSPTAVNLGQTSPGPNAGRCLSFHDTVLNVTAAQINAWADRGRATSTEEASREVAKDTNFSDNCAHIEGVIKKDGIGLIYEILEYNYAKVNYDVRSGTTLIKQDTLKGNQPTVDNLAPGSYTVKSTLPDKAGAIGTAQFGLMVRDTVRPKALCKPLVTLTASPSGLPGDNTTLTVNQVNNNSTDNCTGPLAYSLSRTIFSCADAAATNVTVTLTAQDAAGNTASCTTQIKVQTPVLMPTFNTGVCEQDTLFLFSNVALVQGVEAYSYTWTTPIGSNFTKNPFFPSTTTQYEGPYTLTITSQTGTPGCSATGTVFVDLNNLNVVPPISADSSSYCVGENIRLKTPPYGGTAVTYQWYRRLSGRDSLLATTGSEIHILNNWPTGTYRFFVKIADAGCVSLNSGELPVNVFALPIATVFPESIRKCEGQSFTLGTTSSGSGMTYQWTGPGVNTTMPSPVVNDARKGINDGNYILVVAQNGCFSKPDTARVTIDETPAAPTITGNSPVCEGGTLNLTCMPNTAAEYRWIAPGLDTTFLPENVNVVAKVTSDDAGNWKVIAILQGCVSKVSDPYLVQVRPYPRISPDVDTSLCQGDVLVLKATADLTDVDWTWIGPGMFNMFAQNTTRAPAVAGLYSVIAKTMVGACADTVDVNVVVQPPPKIDTLMTDAPVCASGMSDAKIWAKVSNSPKPLKYTWTRQSTGAVTVTADSIYTIPSISLADNGNYTLVVENADGCISSPKTITINVRNVPPPPTPVPDQSEVCVGENVVFTVTNASVYGGTDVEYLWTTPRSQGTSASNSFTIFNAAKVDSGLYCVRVRVGQCTTQQVCKNLRVKTNPPKPVANANNTTLCSGDVLNLFVAPTPVGATYEWRGPAGFTSSKPDPSIVAVDTNRTGAYQLTLTVNGCSTESDLLYITIKHRPQTPLARPPLPAALCLDQQDTLKLAFSKNSITPGAIYQWIHSATGSSVGPASPDSTLKIPLAGLSFITPGKNTFNVFGSLNGCTSAYSIPVEVQFDKIPNSNAFAGRDTLVCDGKPLTLNATPPTIGTGHWTLFSGPKDITIINPSDPRSVVSGIKAGNTYKFKWTLSNGACRDYSSHIVSITGNQFEPANAGPDIDTCIAGVVRISAVKGQNLSGQWTQMSSQAALGIVIETPDSFTTLVRGLQSGQRYVFTWTLKDIGCGPAPDEKLVRVFSTNVSAGADAESCDPAGNYTLNASPVQVAIGETAVWIPVTPGITVLKSDDPRTTVSGLRTGDNKLIWRTNGGICGVASEDEVIIRYGKPILRDTAFAVAYGTPLAGVDVLKHASLPPAFKYDTIPPFPSGGQAIFVNLGKYTYRPNNGFFGRDSLKYQVCNRECPLVCAVGTAYFDVAPPGTCLIPTIITPNNDRMNDSWILSPACFLQGEGDGIVPVKVQVSVFNQWGDEVFHSEDYAKDAPWDGTWDGTDLPAGTYFFVVRQFFSEGTKDTKRFIIIQR